MEGVCERDKDNVHEMVSERERERETQVAPTSIGDAITAHSSDVHKVSRAVASVDANASVPTAIQTT
jgi:hypothetical protein